MHKALGLVGLIRRQIMSPAEADWLVDEFGCDVEGTRGFTDVDGVVCRRGTCDELRIGGGFSVYGDVRRCSVFIKACRKDAVVFEILRRIQQAGGDVPLRV